MKDGHRHALDREAASAADNNRPFNLDQPTREMIEKLLRSLLDSTCRHGGRTAAA